jgi:ketosteroid isomerase-like protein
VSFTHPDDLHAAFAAAFQARDIAALVDLHEDSAIQLQQDGTVTSHDDLAGVFTRLVAAGLSMQGVPQKAIVAGDLALTSLRDTFEADEPGGARTVTTAEVSRRQADGSWRVVIDVPAFA